MALWVTPEDVVERWVGDDPPALDGVVVRLVDDAETILRATYPDLVDRVGLSVDPNAVKLVVARMVSRVLRNPDGTRQVTETVGPFSRNRTFGGDTPGAMALTAEERRLLGDTAGRSTAFTVTTDPPRPPREPF